MMLCSLVLLYGCTTILSIRATGSSQYCHRLTSKTLRQKCFCHFEFNDDFNQFICHWLENEISYWNIWNNFSYIYLCSSIGVELLCDLQNTAGLRTSTPICWKLLRDMISNKTCRTLKIPSYQFKQNPTEFIYTEKSLFL